MYITMSLVLVDVFKKAPVYSSDQGNTARLKGLRQSRYAYIWTPCPFARLILGTFWNCNPSLVPFLALTELDNVFHNTERYV